MLHCSRINHVHFGVILAAWELYLSSNFNFFIEQCKISQFFLTWHLLFLKVSAFVSPSHQLLLFSPLSLQTHDTSQIMQFQHDDSLLSYKNFFHMMVAFLGSRHDNSQIHKFSNVVDIQSLQCRCILTILCIPTRKQPTDSLLGNSQFNTHLPSIWIKVVYVELGCWKEKHSPQVLDFSNICFSMVWLRFCNFHLNFQF
jgi:hypothetical protein